MNNNLVKNASRIPYNKKLTKRAQKIRRNMTISEKIFWNKILKNINFKFLRQRIIDNFIVDFYCPKLKLIIEIDGDSHFDEFSIEYDKKRTDILESYNLKVIRYLNSDIKNNFENIWIDLNNKITELQSTQQSPPSPPH
jgi:very-short-patch-repair endonuclease